MCGDSEPKLRMFKVSRKGMGSWISRDWDTIRSAELEDSEIGDEITITVCEMTEAELEALPEFEGW